MTPMICVPYASNCSTFNLLPVVNPSMACTKFPVAYNLPSPYNPNERFLPEELKLKRKAYEKRNVYKSIIRHTFKYIQDNNWHIIVMLRNQGFTIESIETALQDIELLAKQENEKGKPKNSRKTLNKMLESKSVYTYILKESLEIMINNWRSGTKGKVQRKNVQIYNQVCEEYYNKAISLLNKSASII